MKILHSIRSRSPLSKSPTVHCFGVFKMYNGDLTMCSSFENFYTAYEDTISRRVHSNCSFFIIEGDFDISPSVVQPKK